MSEIEEIKVLWEGPFSIDEILEDKIDAKKYSVMSNSIGLYMIYGSHPLYGDNSLVYIGRTIGKKDKSQDTDEMGFKGRLKNRWVIENGRDPNNVEIYLGMVISDEESLTTEKIIKNKLIEKSETLLINALKPAYNSSNIQSANVEYLRPRYLLHNYGHHRQLPAVLDSKYFWQEYKNNIIVEECLKEGRAKVESTDGSYGGELDHEYYGINNDYSIWFGIDYEIWSREKLPYMFQVYSTDEKIMEKLKKLKNFKHYEYQGTDEYFDTFYLEELLGDIEERFDEKVKELISQVDKILK